MKQTLQPSQLIKTGGFHNLAAEHLDQAVHAAAVYATRQAAHLMDEVTEERGTGRKFHVVDVTIQGLVHSEDKLRHAANLHPKFFRIARADIAQK